MKSADNVELSVGQEVYVLKAVGRSLSHGSGYQFTMETIVRISENVAILKVPMNSSAVAAATSDQIFLSAGALINRLTKVAMGLDAY